MAITEQRLNNGLKVYSIRYDALPATQYKEMSVWCKERYGLQYKGRWDRDESLYFTIYKFFNKNDALMFLLRWPP